MFKKITIAFWILFLLGLLTVGLFVASIGYNFNGWYGNLPKLEALENPDTELASELYSEDGVLLGKYFRTNRTSVNYEDISPNLINALIASEDIRFYEHSGIDLKGTFAIPYSLLIRGKKRGSSTITQQLAKNLFKTRTGDELGSLVSDRESFPGNISAFRLIVAKIKEWILAIRIEKAYTKKEIITLYLNTVDFGSNAFGIQVASETFFNESPDQLNVQQSATLIGLLQSTTRYSPILNPDNSIVVRNQVINQLAKYGYLPKQEADSIKRLPIVTDQYSVESHNTGIATYFRSEVQKELLQFAKEYGYDLYSDGLRIYTTLNAKMQVYAEEAVREHMTEYQALFFDHWKGRNPWIDENGREMPGFLENAIRKTQHYKYLVQTYGEGSDSLKAILNRPHPMRVFTWTTPDMQMDTVLSPLDSLKYYKHFLHAGMLAMQPDNGHIKAWVGGINHRYFKYDHVKQGFRQPGSTFKPILYTAAIDNKFHPCYLVPDSPVTFTVREDKVTKSYTPQNAEGYYSNELLTLRQALAKSVNSIAAYLIKEINPRTVAQYAYEKFGIGYLREKYNIGLKIEAVPALALGTSDVSLFELVPAYGTFVNRGIWTEPMFLTRIEDKNGKILKRFVPKTIEALDEELAYIMTYMLRGSNEIEGGTSRRLLRYKFKTGNEVGGKTGTTSNYSDAWFIGFTTELVVGVWTGGEDRAIHFRSLKYGQGGRQALPIFAKFLEKAYADDSLNLKKGAFPLPSRPLQTELDCDVYNQQFAAPVDTTNIDQVPDMGSDVLDF